MTTSTQPATSKNSNQSSTRKEHATTHNRKRALSWSEPERGEGSDSRLPQRRKAVKVAGPAFDEIPSDIDPRWDDVPEKPAKHGPSPDPLVRMITRPCYPHGQEHTTKNQHFRCIASSVCQWACASRDRQRRRIYTHAVHCRALARWQPKLFAAAERALANMAPGGFQPSDQEIPLAPDLKPQLITNAAPHATSSNPFSQFDLTAQMSHFEQIDHEIVRLLCDSGTPARLVDHPGWGRLLRLMNPQLNYSSPSSSLVREKLIPAEAQRAVLHMREFFKTQQNLSLSFDGLSAGEQPVYTIHVCTADRRTFLYYADVFYGSHNSDYIVDLLLKIIDELGIHCISSIVSDDTNVTKKARRLAATHYPTILNLADPIHKLNLCVQDICLDHLWTSLLIRLRKLLKHFKMSTQAAGKLNAARKSLGIVRRLQSIGKTRFATIYYAAVSVLENLPALYMIYNNGEMDTAANPLPEAVSEVMDASQPAAIQFKLKLTELINLLEPLARAILCLESTHSTISDVYFFWLAALALLNRLLSSNTTTLSVEDKSQLQAIIYYRFSEAMNEAPTDTYITAFFLDPRYRTASIYLDSSNFYAAQAPVVFGSTERSSSRRKPTHSGSRLTGSLYSRIWQQLMWMLRDELMVGQKRPDHPLYQYDALRAKTELTTQLQQYHSGLPPFRQFSVDRESVLEYWSLHKDSHLTFILSYLSAKLFSVLPNSMCDERAGSRLTHMYSKLRTQLDAHSMVEQIQFSQFMAMVDGSATYMERKKSPSRSRFYEIKQETIAKYTDVEPTSDCPVALADEPGEEWLDSRANGKGWLMSSDVPEFGECPSLEHALHSFCIDLNSQTLVDALRTTPGDKLDLSSNYSQPGLPVAGSVLVPYMDASDISWDE